MLKSGQCRDYIVFEWKKPGKPGFFALNLLFFCRIQKMVFA